MNIIELLKKNKTAEPKAFDRIYGALVERKIRRRYSQRDIEAIMNNYLSEPNNDVYIKEFAELQSYRKQCKAEAKAELGIE